MGSYGLSMASILYNPKKRDHKKTESIKNTILEYDHKIGIKAEYGYVLHDM